jgi:uncharacterized protein (TIGR00661 family)
MSDKKDILIAPLDWGLGHTTRCIPLVKKLVKRGHNVTIACNDFQKLVLTTYGLNVTYVFLEGYNVAYTKNGRLTLKIMGQIPKILNSIKTENNWVKEYVKNNKVDFIISDNRFGFYHPLVESVYITHQINIQSVALLNPVLYKIHGAMINNFHHCWIPDTPTNDYAGELSVAKNSSYNYIGLLSRFDGLEMPNELNQEQSFFEFAVLVSGPEPQRSVFEELVVNTFNHSDKKVVIISGGGVENTYQLNENIQFESLPDPARFNQLLSQSKNIILRSGYTSIMDFAILQKPLFFVPTTGQTEQEYLANFHNKQSGIGWNTQEKFTIPANDQFAKLKSYVPTEHFLLEETLSSLGL